MKILMLNYEFPKLGGGGGVVSSYLAQELARHHSVDVITSHYKGLPYYEAIGTIRIFRIPVLMRTSISTATLISMITYPVGAIIQGIRLFRKNRYDVINTHFAVPTGPVGLVLSYLFKTPNILSLHGGDIYDPTKRLSPHRHFLLRWVVRLVLRCATRVVSNSSLVRQKAESFYRVYGIEVVPLGMPQIDCDASSRRALGLDEHDIFIVSVGRLIPRKGFAYLLKALACISDKRVKLLLIGNGPQRKALEGLSRSLGIADRVHFLGTVFGDKKYQYLLNSDIFVLPSVYEPFGMVLLEAMQCGLPIVATNVGGHVDFLQEAKTGYFVAPCDEKALAEKITLLISQPHTRDKIAQYNRGYVSNFHIQKAAQKYEQLCNNVLNRVYPDEKKVHAKKSKRILMLNYEYPPLGGGAGNATYYLLKELSRYDDLFVDLVSASLDIYEEKKVSDAIKVFCLNVGKAGRGAHYQTNKDLMLYFAKSYSFCKSLVKRNRYDLCHAFFGIPCGFVAMKLGIPYIVSLRGSDVPFFNQRFALVDSILFQRVSRMIWQRAKRVVANSDELRLLALRTHSQQDISVIYNGVDTQEFVPQENKAANKKLILISVGRLIQRKGFEFLLRALKDIKHIELLLGRRRES